MIVEKKNCDECKFSELDMLMEPCISCSSWSKFTPKIPDNQETKADAKAKLTELRNYLKDFEDTDGVKVKYIRQIIGENEMSYKPSCEDCKYHDLAAHEYPCCLCQHNNMFVSAENRDISEDQKAKADYGKEQLTLVPRRIIHDICTVRMYGNQKYPNGGPDNWKQVEPERYRDAAFRHFLAYLDDPSGFDKESGLPNLWHLACNIAFLCEMEDDERRIYFNKDGG